MKPLILLLSCAIVLSGCALPLRYNKFMSKPKAPVKTVEAPAPSDGIERVPFRTGVSSVTVERMAATTGCTGGPGAGLMTAPGPVEVYRMVCSNNQVYMARCEFRQCKPMLSAPVRN